MRISHFLMSLGVAAAPLVAHADTKPQPNQPVVRHFEWSMSTGKGRLGVAIMGLTPELREHFGTAKDRGVMISHVEPDSPAAKAGLAVGDIITDVGSHPIDSAQDVVAALNDFKKNQQASIAIVRDAKPLTLIPTLVDDPQPAFESMGFDDMPDFEDMMREMQQRQLRRPPQKKPAKPSVLPPSLPSKPS